MPKKNNRLDKLLNASSREVAHATLRRNALDHLACCNATLTAMGFPTRVETVGDLLMNGGVDPDLFGDDEGITLLRVNFNVRPSPALGPVSYGLDMARRDDACERSEGGAPENAESQEPVQEPTPFAVGDVVQLKSGGPGMTVVWIDDSEAGLLYFLGAKNFSVSLPFAALEAWTNDGAF